METQQKTDIQKLEELILSDDLEKLNLYAKKFNVFSALKLQNNEIRHSNFLGWIFDPTETHNLGDYFFKEFFKIVLYENNTKEFSIADFAYLDFSDIEVLREFKNIDLLIKSTSNNFICVIENKIWSKEHSNQLNRYKSEVNNLFPSNKNHKKLFLYLAPEVDSTTEAKIQEEGYISTTYDCVLKVLKKTIMNKENLNLNEEVFTFIKHYKEMIERDIMTNEKVVELCRKIYSNNREAIDLINQHGCSRQEDIKEIIEGFLNKESNIILEEDNPLSFIRFTDNRINENLRELKIAEDKTWTKSEKMLLFELENRKDYLKLLFTIGPGENEDREKVSNIFPSDKKYKRTNSENWTRVYSETLIDKKVFNDEELLYIEKEALTEVIEKKLKRIFTPNEIVNEIVDILNK